MTENINSHIIIVSMAVFIILNVIENIIHYNNGKNKDKNDIISYFNIPSVNDFIIIIIVMLLFAFLQGILTYFFSKIY
jgi:quinol-cytochrome oxidoreductase complex cytochrome b subunit